MQLLFDSQWASILEIHYAAKELNNSVLYRCKDQKFQLGQGRVAGAVSLRHQHFVGIKLRKVSKGNHEKLQCIRAGMQRQQDRQTVAASLEVDVMVARLIRSIEVDITQYGQCGSPCGPPGRYA